MVKTLNAKEIESEQRVAEVRELQATIERMRGDSVERERRLSELDKKLLAMNGSMSRLESNKQLLELKVKELEEVHEPTLIELKEVKSTCSRLEAELVREGDRRKAAESLVHEKDNLIRFVKRDLAAADAQVKDAEFAHVITINKLFGLIDERAAWTTVADFARARDQLVRQDQSRNGRPRVDKSEAQLDEDDKVRQELLRQRDKMHKQVEDLEAELKRTRALGRASSMRLSDEAQRAHEHLNEARRQVSEKDLAHLPTPPYTSPHLPTPPHTSPHLPTPPRLS